MDTCPHILLYPEVEFCTYCGAQSKEKPGDDKLLKQPIVLAERTYPDIPSEGSSFITKDSGNKQTFSTGMQRNIAEGKARYDLVWKPGLKRIAELYARGAKVYGDRNWEKASTQEELDRFKESANRHFEQWMLNEIDEDHMAAVVFNLFGAEMVKAKLK